MIRNRSTLTLVLGVALALVLSVGGCSSTGGSGTTAEKVVLPIPADSPLATVEVGMSDLDVRKIMGEPDDANMYMTGKAWIPFYYGPDTHRTDWKYSKTGRVVFSRNRYSGALKVVRIIYNPEEP